LLGAATVARKLSMKTLDRYLLAGFIVGAVSVQLIHLPPLATVVISVAGGMWGVRTRGA